MSRFQPATPPVGSARILAEQHGAEIRDDFLTTDNQNDATRAGHDRTELASAGRRDQKRGLLRHNADAADNPVGRGSKLTHFTAPHFAIHRIETRAKWLIEIGIARCLRRRRLLRAFGRCCCKPPTGRRDRTATLTCTRESTTLALILVRSRAVATARIYCPDASADVRRRSVTALRHRSD